MSLNDILELTIIVSRPMFYIFVVWNALKELTMTMKYIKLSKEYKKGLSEVISIAISATLGILLFEGVAMLITLNGE